MEFLFAQLSNLRKNYFLLLICLLLIIINDAIILGDFYILKSKKVEVNNDVKLISDDNKNDVTSTINVDIKGYVKKPGVYTVYDNMTVNDVIKLAGGLKKGATTDNINLSKKVNDQMVIIISKKDSNKKTNSSVATINDVLIKNEESALITISDNSINNDSNSTLVNINIATVDDLLKLPGIGQSKADAIISYREKEKFNSIEDIKKVSGIGDALFEKIKDYITV
ncbi:MAG: DUF655 domain-containing protein [Bacilli bacterium]|nr:DUF655 domain-containing protein [Bacilli bacterium]